MSLTISIRKNIDTPDAKLRYNEGLFSRVAKEYDIATRVMSFGRDQAWKRRLIELLPNMDSPKCVDLACGTGDLTFALSRKYPKGEVVGIDLTPSMIDVARERNTSENITFQSGDMCHTSLADQSVNIVTGSYALRNAPVLNDALSEIRRILRPGGVAAFLDFSKTSIKALQPFQLALLKAWGGFCGILVHGGPEHAYIAESLRQFPDHQSLRNKISENGFYLKESQKCLAGMLEILVLAKTD